jgi:hypothetical protein
MDERLVCFVGAMSVAIGIAAPLPARASERDSQTLARAEVIRSELDADYRRSGGNGLRVTEAGPTGVVDSLTLVVDLVDLPHVVSASNGVYFAVCTRRGHCPYPARSASLPALARLPRRLGLELALRTFRETAAELVVVSLPTTRPTWLVFERDDLEGAVDAGLEEVDRLTLPRLFLPIPLLPPTHETILAVSFGLFEP